MKKLKEFFQQKKKAKPQENIYFLRKRLFAVLFIFVMLLAFITNIKESGQVIKQEVEKRVQAVVNKDLTLREGVSKIEDAMVSNLAGRMKYIEIFSYTQNVLGKREINNFDLIKDETGSLHYASFYKNQNENCFEYAMRVKRLKDYVSQYGTDVLFVVAPSKFITNDRRTSQDMPVNDPQVLVDETLFYLNRLGIETLDLNCYIPNKEVPYEQAFFKSDHHWTIPAAFCATKILADTLNERFDYNLDTQKYLASEQFRKITYKDVMLGSMGRRSGANYSGLDDMTAIYPNYHIQCNRHTLEEYGGYSDKSGDIMGTLISTEALEQSDIYKGSPYDMYINGLRTYEHIENESIEDGKTFFMIRDSYFSPVITFMTPMVKQIDAVWSLEESEQIDIENLIKSEKYDCIVIEMYPYNIEDEAFRYFLEEEE